VDAAACLGASVTVCGSLRGLDGLATAAAGVIIAVPLAALDMYYYGWGNAPSVIPFIHPLYSSFY
jgi:hypothetical protein